MQDKQQLYVQVTTLEQLRTTICSSVVRGIYVNIDLAANPTYQDAVMRIVKEHSDIKFFLALPHILRKRSYHMLDSYNRLTESKTFSGVLSEIWKNCRLVNIDYKGQNNSGLYIICMESTDQSPFIRSILTVILCHWN